MRLEYALYATDVKEDVNTMHMTFATLFDEPLMKS